MFRHRQRAFGRKTRRRIARVSFLVVLAALGAFAGRAIQDELSPRLDFSPTATAYATDQARTAASEAANSQLRADLPLLEDLWDVGGGPAVGIRYVAPPKVVRAGAPLTVAVHADKLNGQPFAGALVEVSWKLGAALYHDVTYTDAGGNVDVKRLIDDACAGKRCLIGVRLYKDDLQSVAYTKFTAR